VNDGLDPEIGIPRRGEEFEMLTGLLHVLASVGNGRIPYAPTTGVRLRPRVSVAGTATVAQVLAGSLNLPVNRNPQWALVGACAAQ
jgi:hypothetical protein